MGYGRKDPQTIRIEATTDAGLKQKVDGLESQLAQTAYQIERTEIIPDDMEASTDLEKVQMAIEKAIEENRIVAFDRIYNVTGGTLIINKASEIGRQILYLVGRGGGLKKDDTGYIFSSTLGTYVGDINTEKMKFLSIPANGTKVWNGNRVIRLWSNNDSFIGIDTVFEANDKFAQSIKFINPTITGGKGWAFEWRSSYDVVIDKPTIEHREHGIRNTSFTMNPDNNTLRITNGIFEGLSGKALELGSSFGVVISGNYMERNEGGYIDLSISDNAQNGLTIMGNTFQQSDAQLLNNTPAIKIKNVGMGGVFSGGNVSLGVLYENISSNTTGRLTSVGDVSYNNKKIIGVTNVFSELGRVNTLTNGASFGRIGKYHTNASKLVSAGTEEVIELSFPDVQDLSTDDFITITSVTGSGDGNISLKRWSVSNSTSKASVRVVNNSTGSQTITVRACVIRLQ